MLKKELNGRHFLILEILTIVGLSLVPVIIGKVFGLPYRVNIFLSWEGAYRLYSGEVPYKDFGLPMGYGYWVIPAMFFKLFGPYMSSLIKAQVFINILSGITFRGILNTLDTPSSKRYLAIMVFGISYSLFNLWPWYNHSVFVFQFIGLFFTLFAVLKATQLWKQFLFSALGGFFVFFSFYTKQDGGALGFLIAMALLSYHALVFRKWKELGSFIAGFGIAAIFFIVPYTSHGFGYWFNLGQEPHNSRFSSKDILDAVLHESQWIKFYILAIVTLLIWKARSFKELIQNKRLLTFGLLALGVMAEAFIIQVTSYTPPDNNIFFHSFAFAFIIAMADFPFKVSKVWAVIVGSLLILFWWSGSYWKYVDRLIAKVLPKTEQEDPDKVVSKNTFVIREKPDFEDIPMSQWVPSNMPAFGWVNMPASTVEGMNRVKDLPLFQNTGNKKPVVLNMTELTPLAHELGYEFPSGRPLWYHKNVAIFDPQIEVILTKIKSKEYDLVLFEVVPYLNNFFPDEVHEALQEHYKLKDKFLAPRRPTDSHVEVYMRD